MAVTKKTVTPVTETKETTKVETVKAEEKVEKEKKAPAKKAATKKTTTAKKAELKSALCVQFNNKSYSQEELVKIAKDVWKYDLKQKVSDLTNIDLYVKPEESKVYYVMNDAYTGSFDI